MEVSLCALNAAESMAAIVCERSESKNNIAFIDFGSSCPTVADGCVITLQPPWLLLISR